MLGVYIHDHFLPCVETASDKLLKLWKVPPYSSTDNARRTIKFIITFKIEKATQIWVNSKEEAQSFAHLHMNHSW